MLFLDGKRGEKLPKLADLTVITGWGGPVPVGEESGASEVGMMMSVPQKVVSQSQGIDMVG